MLDANKFNTVPKENISFFFFKEKQDWLVTALAAELQWRDPIMTGFLSLLKHPFYCFCCFFSDLFCQPASGNQQWGKANRKADFHGWGQKVTRNNVMSFSLNFLMKLKSVLKSYPNWLESEQWEVCK